MRTIVLALIPAVLLAADSPSPERIRAAAEKAVSLLQTSQRAWKQDCASCHHQTLPALALRAAMDHGLKFDESTARATAVQIASIYSDLDRAVQYTHLIDPAMDDGLRLLAADASGMRPNLAAAVYARHIALSQHSDGHWATIDMRPPQSFGPFAATATAMRAIQLYSNPSLTAETQARVHKAQQWMEANVARNTEERSQQLIALLWAGSPQAVRARLAKELMATQQADGGWNSIEGANSDAYSTGHALVALADAGGVATSETAWLRGVQFLLSTQQTDGSWHVVSRLHPPAAVSPPYFETGYPYGHDQFISSMGAAYAVMALARALGPAQTKDATSSDAVPAVPESWSETVLFGSAADVRRLLDEKKLDANAATKAGGTTALMMAVPDMEKTKLLIDRGAKANTPAKDRFSALLVACTYPGSAPVVKLLLDHGAQVNLPKGAARPRFNATPLNLAANTGDAELTRLLLQAGARPEEKMLVMGLFPGSPVLTALSFDDAPTVAALLDKGTAVDTKDDEGVPLLAWAAIGNELKVARLLISRGANVNLVDKKGMTPLLYAASIDFGDSVMIDLLLKAGADPMARTKEGLTANDLARKYNHRHLVPTVSASASAPSVH
jgi:ankyrin repeat protein